MRRNVLPIGIGSLLVAGGTAISYFVTPLTSVSDRSFQPRATRQQQLATVEDPIEKELLADLLDRYDQINSDYQGSVRPLFEKACFDCHYAPTHLPWYNFIPGVRQLIAHDISEAKGHLDMSGEFPFAGHGSVKEDLEAIKKTIRKNEMPPGEYLFMHPEARLSRSEKDNIYRWLETTSQILSN